MNAFIKIGAVAAVVLLAVVMGSRFLPGDASVGGPATSGSANTISGQVTFLLGDQQIAVDVDASANGSALSGTAVVSHAPDRFTIGLECARMFDDTTWILGGEIEESTAEDQAVGTRSAVIVRDGAPQQVILWFEDPPPAADCPAFVDSITDEAIAGSTFGPVQEGEISLPASLDG
jgi:hypothetical protein